MISIITTICNDLLNLFYPNICKLCSKPLVEGEKQLCLHCLCDLPRITNTVNWALNPVEQLLLPSEKRGAASAFLYYEKGGGVQQLIHSFKYYGDKKLAYNLGRQAAVELQHSGSVLTEVDMLLPVPLNRWKQWSRGYNQAEWIARGMQSAWKIPVCKDAVKRIKKSSSQTNKSVYERWLNMEDTFILAKGEQLAGKQVLLIDDVMTSGATIGALIRTVAEAPDVRIHVFALSAVIK